MLRSAVTIARRVENAVAAVPGTDAHVSEGRSNGLEAISAVRPRLRWFFPRDTGVEARVFHLNAQLGIAQ